MTPEPNTDTNSDGDSDTDAQFDPAPMIPDQTNSRTSMPVEAIAESVRNGNISIAEVRDDDRISIDDLPLDSMEILSTSLPTYNSHEFLIPDEHYETPRIAEINARKYGLDDYHVCKIDGEVRYVPGKTVNALRAAIDERPRTNLETSKFAEYSANDRVMVGDDERGTVLELHTDTFEFGEQSFGASQTEPLYVVATEDRTVITDGAELSSSDWGPISDAPKEDIEDAEVATNYTDRDRENIQRDAVIRTNDVVGEIDVMDDVGWDDYPPTWEESERPARLILMDMWADFNASFDGCVREMRGKIRSPKAFCGSTKDEVYLTDLWR